MELSDIVAKIIKLVDRAGDELEAMASDPELEARLDRIPTKLGSYGVDPFGFDPAYLRKFVGFGAWLYRRYFRAQAFGIANIPDGPCLVVANHSGQLPFDAMMINYAAFLEREPPRVFRSMVERFVPATPFVSTFIARTGQVLGTPENCRRLLEAGEAILVCPEGVRGLNKTWDKRYQLQRFGQGFMRLTLENRVPIVPAVVIGAEEQAPSFFNLERVGRLFGMPAFPVTPTHPLIPALGLLPLPTRYRIYFGEPMLLEGDSNDEDEVIMRLVEEVRATMQRMVDVGLRAREHVFW